MNLSKERKHVDADSPPSAQGLQDRRDEHFMALALQEAQRAAAEGEVPTGCVIVGAGPEGDGVGPVLARAHNQVELLKDPTAHAEMIAITQAANALGDWRLNGASLYVTKEPCAMCAGAIVLARIARVVYGVADPQRGGATSVFGILNHPRLNHRCTVASGVCEEECRSLLRSFFAGRRRENSTAE
jgi:tRNA(adenine34) deaminase